MILTLKEAQQVLKAFSKQEIETIATFAGENPIAHSSIEQFSLLKGIVGMKPLEDSDEISQYFGFEANLRAMQFCTQDFLYLPGTMRILNFWMMQLLAIDRKKNPAIAARVLPVALQISQLQNCPLHTVWFATRWEELQNGKDGRELAQMPILLMDHEKVKDEKAEERPPLSQTIEHVYPQREAYLQAAIDSIAEQVALAQSHDFDLDASSIGWWPGGEGVSAEDMSKCYYFPTIEAIDVFAQIDPLERRRMEECLGEARSQVGSIAKLIARKMASMLAGFPNEAMVAPLKAQIAEMGSRVDADAPENKAVPLDQEGLPDIVKLNTSLGVYMLMRAFHDDNPASTVFWHICLLEAYLRRGLTDLAAKAWEECKPAFDYHISPIHGLWLLDLRRKLIHLQGNGETLGADLNWLHTHENKFVKALQTGNYTSES